MGLAAHAVGVARMGQIDPFSGAMPLQRARSVAERVRQSRADSKHLPDDEATAHVVEDPDAVTSISEDHSHQSPGKQQQPNDEKKNQMEKDDKPARLDVTA
jgi:hypothetical protein